MSQQPHSRRGGACRCTNEPVRWCCWSTCSELTAHDWELNSKRRARQSTRNGANRKLCEWMEVHSSTIGRSVEDTMTRNDTRITHETHRETATNLVKPHPRNSRNSANQPAK
eukprot:1001150-Prymnesium_polylepis.1